MIRLGSENVMRKLILFAVIALTCAGCAHGQWYGGAGVGAFREAQR